MEVKHQVFVSSTYKDLVEERKAVIHALLELDCIPAGMELFPATDEDAWTLIKEVINGCDYYILILGGKYGSANANGIGYTEMEYDYAVSINKPIITFVHENLDALSAAHVEKAELMQSKLSVFRKKAEEKHCKYWLNAEDLGGKVSRSLIQLRKRHPSPGWVPGKFAATEEMLREFEEMRAKLAEYEVSKLIGANSAPPGAETLKQGTDLIYHEQTLKVDEKLTKEILISVTWDKIFSYCGASLVGECSDSELLNKMQLAFLHAIDSEVRQFNRLDEIVVPYVLEDQIKIQFQALGLMMPGRKKRAVADTARYWTLTPYGEKYLVQIQAVRRS